MRLDGKTTVRKGINNKERATRTRMHARSFKNLVKCLFPVLGRFRCLKGSAKVHNY